MDGASDKGFAGFRLSASIRGRDRSVATQQTRWTTNLRTSRILHEDVRSRTSGAGEERRDRITDWLRTLGQRQEDNPRTHRPGRSTQHLATQTADSNSPLFFLEIGRRKRLVRKKARTFARPYTKGELNATVDALLHPLARVDPWFLVIDALIHGLVERNPPETVAKFVQYNLPTLVAEILRKRKGRMTIA